MICFDMFTGTTLSKWANGSPKFRTMVQARPFGPPITVFRNPEERTANLGETVPGLRIQLADPTKTDQKEDSLDEIIKSLGTKEQSASVSIATLAHGSLKFTSIYRNPGSQTHYSGAESISKGIASTRSLRHYLQTFIHSK